MKNTQYIKRKLEDQIIKYIETPEIIAIIGARQCGKTTLLSHIYNRINANESGNFISFEDQHILNMFESDINGFIQLYVKSKKYLFIDEFQYAKHGGKKLKYIFDLHKIKIFISGSSAIDLSVNAVKFLVGRIFVFELHPLSFEEFLSYKDPKYLHIVEDLRDKFKKNLSVNVGEDIHSMLLKYYDEFAIYGGYPRVVIADSFDEKKEILRNIYNTYFLREVRDILGLVDDYKLSKLIKALALQIGNLIEYKELSILSEYTYPTLKKYLNFLEKTFICSFVRPYYKNKRTEIVKNPKIYFFDTGLRNIILDDFRGFDDRPDSGALLENAVFQELIKIGGKVNFWRTKSGFEIDFIIILENRKEVALEVKKHFDKINSILINNFKKTYPEIQNVFVYRKKEKKMINQEGSFYPIYSV